MMRQARPLKVKLRGARPPERSGLFRAISGLWVALTVARLYNDIAPLCMGALSIFPYIFREP